jgi:predicted ATPase
MVEKVKMKKFVVLSGCSGGGKSSLSSELSYQGYTVSEEVCREIIKEHGELDPLVRGEMIITRSIAAYRQAEEMKAVNDDVIFFDRSFLEVVSYFQSIGIHKYDYLINDFRFYHSIFLTPPWKEIFRQDAERKHSFEDAVKEYGQIIKFYPKHGYDIIELPKLSVKERIKFILDILKLEY